MQPLDIFYEICKIPHPSKNTSLLKEYIINFAKNRNCKVNIDDAGNIHIFKGKPKICLQAHYDMVQIGEQIIPIIEGNILKAKDSSLGADNGAALAAILSLSNICNDFEAIITNDEEVGMIGANNINIKTKSKTMINLDSEHINEICIGCAGGFDADIKLDIDYKPCTMKYVYELKAINFSGGHSGIDINKNIKNAIVELMWAIVNIDCKIIELVGGEKRNSIPVNAKAIICTDKKIDINKYIYNEVPILQNIESNNPHIIIKELNNNYNTCYDKNIINQFLLLHNGVYDTYNNDVISSLNFSLIENNILKIMFRSNREVLIHRQINNLKKLFFNGEVEINGLYMPWEREDSNLLNKIKDVYKKHNIDYKVIEIHAGLECGILKQKCNLNEIISIGPTIKNPHSKNENMDLDSFDKFFNILKNVYINE